MQIQIILVSHALIYIIKNKLAGRYHVECSPEYFFNLCIVLILTVILLFWFYQKGNDKTKQIIKSLVLNFIVWLSVLALGICVRVLWEDDEIMTRVAFTICGISIIKDFWPESQLLKEAGRYVMSKYGRDMLTLLPIKELVKMSNNDVSQLYVNIDRHVRFLQHTSLDFLLWSKTGMTRRALYDIFTSVSLWLVKSIVHDMLIRYLYSSNKKK